MSVELYVVLAVILIGWYVINSDRGSKKKKAETQEIKTLDEILAETEDMYENSTKIICEMFEKSRKEISNIHKDFTREIKINSKKTSQGVKANVK